METVRICIVDPEGRPDRALLDNLRLDLDRSAAPARFAEVEAGPGSKGIEVDVTTLVVGALSSGAAVGLVNVLRAYVQRVRGAIVIEGPGGKATIETGDLRQALSALDGLAPRILGARPET